MSYWIEVRCSEQKAANCFSKILVDSPMEMTRNSGMAAVCTTLLNLTRRARAYGWHQHHSKGWICPSCWDLIKNI